MKYKNICVIGLGYVGLPIAIEFSKHYKVVGFDISKNRIEELKRFKDRNKQFKKKEIKKNKKLKFTLDEREIRDSNIYIITVPTPITNSLKPDLKLLINATKLVSKYVYKGDFVIFESTVYPGCVDNVCIPIIEKITKLKINKDFFCGYSPERINPGDKKNTLPKIKKIVSGSNSYALNEIYNLYSTIIHAGVHKVSNLRTAEASKIIENVQRDLNIALINELALIFNKMNIDTDEVIEAASTKWNFHKYKPGLVGGHCIGVDPYYLTYKSKLLGYKPKIILAGRKLNDSMAKYITLQIEKHIKIKKLSKKNLKILVLGITFKENCPDIRNSQSLKLSKLIKNKYKKVYIYDQVANTKNLKEDDFILVKKIKKNTFDIIILAVPHKVIVNKGIKVIKSYLKQKSLFFDLKGHFNKKYSDFRL